jgi:hypothetical protein
MWVGRRCGNGKDASKIPIFEIGDEKNPPFSDLSDIQGVI